MKSTPRNWWNPGVDDGVVGDGVVRYTWLQSTAVPPIHDRCRVFAKTRTIRRNPTGKRDSLKPADAQLCGERQGVSSFQIKKHRSIHVENPVEQWVGAWRALRVLLPKKRSSALSPQAAQSRITQHPGRRPRTVGLEI